MNAGKVVGRHRHGSSASPRPGSALASGGALDGGHRRHRDRARRQAARRHRAQRRRRARQRRRPAELQGDDAERRAQSRFVLRLHQCLLDAEMRPHLALRLPAAQPHGPARLRPLRRRGSAMPGSSGGRCSISARAMSAAPRAACRARGRSRPGASTRITSRTSPRCGLRPVADEAMEFRKRVPAVEGPVDSGRGARHLTFT